MRTTSTTLNQDQIDEIFSDPPPQEAGEVASALSDPGLRVYDFRRPSRISSDRLRSLEAMYGLLGRTIEGWLAGRVREHLELRLVAVEHFTFGEFVLSLSAPCASYVFDVGHSAGQQAVVDFDPKLGTFLVERLLGGIDGPAVQPRGMTYLEQRVAQIVAQRVAADLAEVWKDHVALDFVLAGFESVPDMLQAANREDAVLVATYSVALGGADGSLSLCLPFTSLEKFFAGNGRRRVTGAGEPTSRKREERGAAERNLRRTRVPVSVRLPAFRHSLEQLGALRAGSTLTTPLPATSPVDILVAGERRFVGTIGRSGRMLGVRVDGRIETASARRPGAALNDGAGG